MIITGAAINGNINDEEGDRKYREFMIQLGRRFGAPPELTCPKCISRYFPPDAVPDASSLYDPHADVTVNFMNPKLRRVLTVFRVHDIVRLPDDIADRYVQDGAFPEHVAHIPQSQYGMPGVVGTFQLANGTEVTFPMDGRHRWANLRRLGLPCYAFYLDIDQTAMCVATPRDMQKALEAYERYGIIT